MQKFKVNEKFKLIDADLFEKVFQFYIGYEYDHETWTPRQIFYSGISAWIIYVSGMKLTEVKNVTIGELRIAVQTEKFRSIVLTQNEMGWLEAMILIMIADEDSFHEDELKNSAKLGVDAFILRSTVGEFFWHALKGYTTVAALYCGHYQRQGGRHVIS